MFAFFAWSILHALKLLGFQPLDPLAGSFAAWWQAWFDAAFPAGGLFAFLRLFGLWLLGPIAGSFAAWWQAAWFGPAVLYCLQLLGSGSLGPIAGSFAAWWQAFWYGAAVPAGSIFAYFQHIAMTWFI